MGRINSVVDMNISRQIADMEKEIKGTVVSIEPKAMNAAEETILKGTGRIGDLEIKLEKVIRRYV